VCYFKAGPTRYKHSLTELSTMHHSLKTLANYDRWLPHKLDTDAIRMIGNQKATQNREEYYGKRKLKTDVSPFLSAFALSRPPLLVISKG
jgi:hypothetical protein